jgi:hypothetical protein
MDDSMSSLLKLGRDEILHRLAAGDSFHSERKTSYEVDKLLISTVDLAKPSLCSVADISGHFLRVALQLWKVIVSGTGELDLKWANPASVIPLRVHSFATLLQLLGSSTLYFSKRGVTQLDGTSKWNLVSISRVIALFFDEWTLFGEQAEEAWSNDFPAGSVRASDSKVADATHASDSSVKNETLDKKQKLPNEKRRRHIRSNYEINNFSLGEATSPTEGRSDGRSGQPKEFGTWSASSLGDSLKQIGGQEDFEDFLKSLPSSLGPARSGSFSNTPQGSEESKDDRSSVATKRSLETQDSNKGTTTAFKIDSKNDFRFALEAGSLEEVTDDAVVKGPASTAADSSGANAAMAMIKAFRGPQPGSRRWMTAPAPNLATIREDNDGDVVEAEVKKEEDGPKRPEGPLDALDTELVLRPKGSSVKQMRVPKLNRATTTGTSGDVDLQMRVPMRNRAKTTGSDEDALQAFNTGMVAPGTSFLDMIGQSLGEG